MNKVINMTPAQIARFALLIGTGAFVVWIGLLLLAWKLLGLDTVEPALWSYFEGVSGAAVLGTVFGGGLVVLVQLVELIDSSKRDTAMVNLQTYREIFKLMMSESNIEARRWIYQELHEDPKIGLAGLDSDGLRRIKLVLNSFDYLGLLLKQDCVTDETIIEWASPFVVKTWHKIGPYVDYEAERRNEPDYYHPARLLAERCSEFRHRQVGDHVPTWVDDPL